MDYCDFSEKSKRTDGVLGIRCPHSKRRAGIFRFPTLIPAFYHRDGEVVKNGAFKV